ncbi:MAG: TIGR03960 family B12-binding radical SAM protein [Clostridia bacterium]|nr:TIGR03960 family B12-binding radical SAM protein [Clostridia bacterium]
MFKEFEKHLLNVQKPGRYVGGELNSVVKDKNDVDVRFAFCFPDTYEIGMSHLGMKILYSQFNARNDIWCERVFAPWIDAEKVMVENNIPLYALESHDPIKDFDFVGFTLQYELSYSNVLNMLKLAGIPLKTSDRKNWDTPVVVAGGPCACNPEPLADFIDIFFLGEGEEVDLEVIDLYKESRKNGISKAEFLKLAAQIEGVYVPSLYTVSYNEDGTVASVNAEDGVPSVIKKRIIKDLNTSFYPEKFVVPYVEIVHDRAVQEIFRGCIRGCRFCQAGYIYRPVREKSADVANKQANSLCETCGYEEVSLNSLSTSDYREIEDLLEQMLKWSEQSNISIALPSLRIDNFPKELLEKVQSVRKSSLTFAPEAGTQRLRDVINKNITEDEIISTCKMAFESGYTAVKLYFMLGLPTETNEDLEGMAKLAQKVVDLYYSNPARKKGKPVNVSISVATFVPKPFTPFEFEPQVTLDEIVKKQEHLLSSVTSKKISVSYHQSNISFLEGVFARGDRRLGAVLEKALEKGVKFDGWDECFKFDEWLNAFEECGIDATFYSSRKREYDEIMPWDHLDYGVTKKFLISENKLAHSEVTTKNCREQCAGCGATCFGEGVCYEKR